MMIDRETVSAAAARIAPYVRHTPVLQDDLGTGAPVTLKLELLQHAGSFKPRGAFNRMLSAAIPSEGVIAASGGNHGAAVAYAARTLGVTAEIFVPAATPATKIARIASYGARVVRIGETYAEALVASRQRQAETGALEIHAYDHPDILAGQGTVAREFEQDAPDLTHILVATGGGGLIGGIAAWYAARVEGAKVEGARVDGARVEVAKVEGARVEVISVEPENCPGLHDALRAGHPVPAAVGGLAADSLGARQVGALMFPIAQRFISHTVLVPDASIAAAQRLLWDRFRLVAEPGGATATAALLSGRFQPPPGARVGVLVCGANTDPANFAG